jgi:hypothetical protein
MSKNNNVYLFDLFVGPCNSFIWFSRAILILGLSSEAASRILLARKSGWGREEHKSAGKKKS